MEEVDLSVMPSLTFGVHELRLAANEQRLFVFDQLGTGFQVIVEPETSAQTPSLNKREQMLAEKLADARLALWREWVEADSRDAKTAYEKTASTDVQP